MEKITAADVFAAEKTIRPYLAETPLAQSLYLNTPQRNVYFKLESAQPVRSFKIRGALNKMCSLTPQQRAEGVATVSSGNHGSAVGYAAKLLGIENALVIVPETTPESKTDRIAFYGARVLRMGADYDEAHALGMQYIREQGMTYIDAYYEDPLIYAGQGTAALEILRQLPQTDTVVVPIGGGGLITGIAAAAKQIRPEIRIIGVQTECCPAMIRSFADHVFYEEYPVTGETICDALVGGVGKRAFEMLPALLDDIIEVKEKTIRRAVRHMILNEKYAAEGGSAATLAALMDEPERVGGKEVVLLISGANIDAGLMRQILAEE